MSAQGTASHGQKSMEANRKSRPSKRRLKSGRQFTSRKLEDEVLKPTENGKSTTKERIYRFTRYKLLLIRVLLSAVLIALILFSAYLVLFIW